MSYDVALHIKIGHKKYEVLDIGNYTYNCASMFYNALGIRLYDLNDICVESALSVINKGINDMREYPDKYKKMNPTNGWGDYESALNFLIDIQQACIDNPGTYISVS